MKKLILIIALALININIMFGQCPERGDVIFSSQSDIDDFVLDYPDCTVIKYSLHIGDIGNLSFPNNSINDLTKLSKIECTGTFEFNNINLPDSTSNLEGSQGYVSYSIKAKTGLPENTIIKNTSAIYFDYNPPIITNTVENILVSELPNITWCQDVNGNGLGNPNESIESCEQPEGYVMDCSDLNDLVSIEEESISDAITIYPNPSTGVFRLAAGHANFRKATFSLYNASGQLIVEPTALNQRELSLSYLILSYLDLGNGVYY